MGNQQNSKPEAYKPRTPKNGGRGPSSSGSGRVDFGPELNLTTSSDDDGEDGEFTKRLKSIQATHDKPVVDALAEIVQAFPDMSRGSVNHMLRFAVNSPSTALEDFQKHLAWREANPKSLDHGTTFHPATPADFPRLWMERGGIAKDGSNLLFCQGARYDKAVAGVETYVDRTWNVVDSIFPDDETNGLITCFIDCRPYKGMKNPPAQQLFGYFKAVCAVVTANYPGRVSKVIIYPIPSLLVGLVNVIKRMFSKEVRDKLVFLGGGGSIGSKCPTKLWDYVADTEQFPEAARPHHVMES